MCNTQSQTTTVFALEIIDRMRQLLLQKDIYESFFIASVNGKTNLMCLL